MECKTAAQERLRKCKGKKKTLWGFKEVCSAADSLCRV